MSEIAQELLKRADVIGAWLSGTMTKATDFATEQAIDIAMQYVLFGRVFLTVTEGIALAVAALCTYLWIYKGVLDTSALVNSPGSYHHEDWLPSRFFALLLGGLGSVISGLVFLLNLKEFLLVWTAPKVWLMIELSTLVKGTH